MSNQRTITVFTSKGGKQKIETEVKTWGELKPLVEEYYDLDNLSPTENVNKTTLNHKDAVLPEGNFVLFLRPIKTKSGGSFDNMSFKDLRANLTDSDKTVLEEETGKNWTRVTKQDLINQLNKRDLAQTPEPEIVEEVVTEEVIEESTNAEEVVTNLQRIESVKNLLEEICENSENEEICERVDLLQEEVVGVKDLIEEEDSPETVAERQRIEAEAEADRLENEKLSKELKDLGEGF